MDDLDFSIIEKTFAARLRALTLSPVVADERVETGYPGFCIHRLKCEVLECDAPDSLAKRYIASLEVRAELAHQSFGIANIEDRITRDGDSAGPLIQACAATWMDVTFPALRSLYEGRAEPGTFEGKLSTLTPDLGRPIGWEVFSGQLQIIGESRDALLARFKKQPPIALVLDTLTGYLAEPRLHWCKLYGAVMPKPGLVFGCSIDGQKSAKAEAEMHRKFGDDVDLTQAFEFRQFFAMRPTAPVSATTERLLRHEVSRSSDPAKGWWRRLFGR